MDILGAGFYPGALSIHAAPYTNAEDGKGATVETQACERTGMGRSTPRRDNDGVECDPSVFCLRQHFLRRIDVAKRAERRMVRA